MKSPKHYGRVCEYCGANLDPGERCDCRKAKAAAKPSKPIVRSERRKAV